MTTILLLAGIGTLPACDQGGAVEPAPDTEETPPISEPLPAPTFQAEPPVYISWSILPYYGELSEFLVYSNPTVINHPRPGLSVDRDILATVGCSYHKESSYLSCEPDSLLNDLGCYHLYKADDLWGGLDPADLIVAQCGSLPEDDQDDALYRYGCMPENISYVLVEEGVFTLIRTQEEFKGRFAPAESGDEALSYALMTTGLIAVYDIEIHPNYDYFIDPIEDTHVTETVEGYVVHLYQTGLCGCGTHPTAQVDVLVRHDGTVQWLDGVVAFHDPDLDLCVE